MEEVIGEARATIEQKLDADIAYLHVLRDGKLGPPIGHEHDWVLPPGFHLAPDMNLRGLSRSCSRKRWRRRRLRKTSAVCNTALISIGDTAWNAAENFFGALRG